MSKSTLDSDVINSIVVSVIYRLCDLLCHYIRGTASTGTGIDGDPAVVAASVVVPAASSFAGGPYIVTSMVTLSFVQGRGSSS